MKILTILGLLALLAVAYSIDCGKESSEEEDEQEFEQIAEKNKDLWKKIDHDQSKKQGFAFRSKSKDDRKAMFKEKAKEAKEANKNNPSFCQKANEMDALDDDELQSEFLGLDLNEVKAEEWPEEEQHHGFGTDHELQNLPSNVDHSQATGAVESQGGCGSCWAFAASHTLTGVVAKIGSKSVNDYSEQQLADCVYPRKGGCEGGWMDRAWTYLKGKNAMPEKDYPYNGRHNRCGDGRARGSPFVTGTVKVRGEREMMKVVARHPVALAMLVGKGGFGRYRNGVYDYNGRDCNSLNHAMTIVGYGTENGQKYWKVKNSWGRNWGNQGYIKIKRGKNLCNIETYAMYPTIKSGSGGNSGGGGGGGGDDGPTWQSYKSLKYIYPNHAQDFELAEQFCLQQGSHLPTVDSDSKNNALNDFVRNKLGGASVWIGANSRQGRWGWTETEARYSYTRWNSGQPRGGQCGYMSGGKWSATSCNSSKKYVCVRFGEGGGDDSDDGNDGNDGGSCVDKNKDCHFWKRLCNSNTYVKKNCDKTCGRCGSGPNPSPNCVDKNKDCHFWNRLCNSNTYVKQNCDKTCGRCGSNSNPTCVDKNKDCHFWKNLCNSNQYVKKNCNKSCGRC